jgi:hypothetical protein
MRREFSRVSTAAEGLSTQPDFSDGRLDEMRAQTGLPVRFSAKQRLKDKTGLGSHWISCLNKLPQVTRIPPRLTHFTFALFTYRAGAQARLQSQENQLVALKATLIYAHRQLDRCYRYLPDFAHKLGWSVNASRWPMDSKTGSRTHDGSSCRPAVVQQLRLVCCPAHGILPSPRYSVHQPASDVIFLAGRKGKGQEQ